MLEVSETTNDSKFFETEKVIQSGQLSIKGWKRQAMVKLQSVMVFSQLAIGMV
jgi:hypothetical protein